MFGKILYISDSMAYVQNLAGSNVQADLMNMHVIFESNGERILGEITEVNSSEIKRLCFIKISSLYIIFNN